MVPPIGHNKFLNEQGILWYKATLTHEYVSDTRPDMTLAILVTG